jgi:indole-3-glycerol phosphate synthase
MTDFLAEIVAETRSILADGRYADGVPVRSAGPRASLRAAIERDRQVGALVLEHKRVSPGAGDSRLPVRPLDEFVRAGEAAGATAFSCLAARPRFEGSPREVAALCARTERPVVFKEFVVDPVQLAVAARTGASAVLLLARLARPQYEVPVRDLATEAHRLGLEVLLEFHDRAELRIADGVAADVYGVNARDLGSLSLDRTAAAATLRDAAGLRPMLGLSGVDGPEEAQRFWALGVDGLLVGSGFARASDPVRFAASLRRTASEAP